MRRTVSAVAVVLLALVAARAGTIIKPTTTLTAETANNTSTADTFTAQTNGNLGPSNISKVDMRTLLYPGATTTVYVHFMPWFGQTSHMDVGYSSHDPEQVRRQVNDMLSRGITGAIVDWYGPNKTWNNTTTLLLMQEAELRNGQFTFAVTEDKGALQSCSNTAGCSITQQLIADLTYAYNTFELSPAYARINGRPLIFFFDVDRYTIDWATVVANIPGNPLLIFANSGGFTHSYTSGSYAWVIIDTTNPDNWNAAYLDRFYNAAISYPDLHPFAATYKGFNDTLASWGQNRIMNQNCGQTWLNTFAEIGKYYSSARPLESLQVVTWNDYEEGSALETGIDNCVSISGATTGDTLNWTVTGQENTVDHYTVFISVDGENLMPVADVPTGTHTLDLSAYAFDPGSYTVYVKGVGKPSLKNQMSPPISYTASGHAPSASLAITPLSGNAPLTVTASVAASDPDGNTLSPRIDFGDGAVITASTASHTYSAAGTYTVMATVTDSTGLSATSTAIVTVNIPYAVTVAAPADGATVNSPVRFLATSTSPYPVTGMKIYVDGVGAYSTSAASIDTYLAMAAGTHAVTVKAWNTNGAIASQKLTVSVAANRPPTAALAITPTSGVAPLTVTATITASDSDGTISAASVNFGDATVVSGNSAPHTYSVAGIYTVTATVTDNGGLSATATGTVTVTAPAPAPAPSRTVTIGSPVNGGTYGSPVRVIASASSPLSIRAMKVYVDGSARYSIKAASLDTSLSVTSGQHRITVNAWDASGAVFKSSVIITVR